MPPLKSSAWSRRHYTIVEAMIAIAIFVVVTTLALRFYYDSNRLARRHAEKAQAVLFAQQISQEWRAFVHRRPGVFLIEPNQIVFSDRSTISVRDQQISFNDNGQPKVWALPRGATVVFHQETPPGEAPLLVLELIAVRTPEQRADTYKFRLVATIQPGVKP